jgi:tetratricopeptide (TPR) repeat protein
VSRALYRLAVIGSLAVCASAADWGLARSAHFEVFAQVGAESARPLLVWFEQLREYFEQRTGLKLDERPAVRVIAFGSVAEYEPYRLRPTADAYYVGTDSRDYIVMPAAGEFGVAAHEYWHSIEHARGLRLPPWLNEGLAEYFSTIRFEGQSAPSDGTLENRYRLLRRQPWMALADLVALPDQSPLRDSRNTSGLYYAESWALASMLMNAPEYAPRMPLLMVALDPGTSGDQALSKVYGKTLDEITRDLRLWVENRKIAPVMAPVAVSGANEIEVSTAASFAVRTRLAEVYVALRNLDRAESLYRELAGEAPDDADISAALAALALERGDLKTARNQWRRAQDHHLRDGAAYYRYFVRARNAGFPEEELRPALEQAVALEPGFDDALYNLGLLEHHAGAYEAAVEHLRAMHRIGAGREYGYWTVLAGALTEVGQRKEAKAAADTARTYARNDEERGYATQLGVIALTDPVVQFVRDADGTMHLVTTRARHDGPEWNPFIEPGDQIRRVEARLREIDCTGGAITFIVQTATERLRLTVPDPQHVQMRNAPAEFTCGTQPLTDVVAVFAVQGAGGGRLRGLEFR